MISIVTDFEFRKEGGLVSDQGSVSAETLSLGSLEYECTTWVI